MMKLVKVTKESGLPLMGHIAFGIVDRGTSLVQVRPTTLCNLSCTFCSTDGGPNSKTHKTGYIVEPKYLLEEVNKVVGKKGRTHINIDSVGEPMAYQDLIWFIQEIKKNPLVYFVSMQTNGTYCTKEKIQALEKAGLDRIHLSIHALDDGLAKELAGTNEYNIKQIVHVAEMIQKSNIELLLAPVWLPKINDGEMEKIILLGKKLGCKVGVQKFETHKYGRKIKGMRESTYYTFYKQLKEWEKKYKIKLVYNADELEIERGEKLQKPIQIGERINAKVQAEGWCEKQALITHKERVITVNDCASKVGDRVNARITKNKHNIYLSQKTV